MIYMLDSNTCIHIIKYHPQTIRKKLEKMPVGEVGISSIVAAELAYGVELSTHKDHNRRALEEFLSFVHQSDWPVAAVWQYARLRTSLRRKGTPIGAMDLLIAAHALHEQAVLVTDNIKEFKRVPGLKVENWIER